MTNIEQTVVMTGATRGIGKIAAGICSYDPQRERETWAAVEALTAHIFSTRDDY